jgi:hypothetical protein
MKASPGLPLHWLQQSSAMLGVLVIAVFQIVNLYERVSLRRLGEEACPNSIRE